MYLKNLNYVILAFLLLGFSQNISAQCGEIYNPIDQNINFRGEPLNITGIPTTKQAVYFNANEQDIPSFRQMLGVNMGIYAFDAETTLRYPNIQQIVSSARVFYPMNRDFWNYNNTDTLNIIDIKDKSSVTTYTPIQIKGLKNLTLIVDADGTPTVANNQPNRYKIHLDSNQNLLKTAISSYNNTTIHYMNINYIQMKQIYNELKTRDGYVSPLTATLIINANQLAYGEEQAHQFPIGWFTESEWGVDTTNNSGQNIVFENARAYAKIFARTYAPLAIDCPTCEQIVETVEIGNEIWGYKYPQTNKSILSGFIQGLKDYYGTNPIKIKVLPAAYQAHHSEFNNVTTNPSDVRFWKDDLATRVPKNEPLLHGVNLHLYSNDDCDITAVHSFKPIANPEKTNNNKAITRFSYIKNAWKYTNDSINNRKMFVSEFGWDSNLLCDTTIAGNSILGLGAVGFAPQGEYSIRALLMMARYGVTKAHLFEVSDNDFNYCNFAHHTNGLYLADKKTPKYIFFALRNFLQLAGNLKFREVIKEDEINHEFVYALENNFGNPTHIVAWHGVDMNVQNSQWNASLDSLIQGKTKNINLGYFKVGNSKFVVDTAAMAKWYRLDGDYQGTNLGAIPSITNKSAYFNNNNLTISPAPLLIPIKIDTTQNEAVLCVSKPSNVDRWTAYDLMITVSNPANGSPLNNLVIDIPLHSNGATNDVHVGAGIQKITNGTYTLVNSNSPLPPQWTINTLAAGKTDTLIVRRFRNAETDVIASVKLNILNNTIVLNPNETSACETNSYNDPCSTDVQSPIFSSCPQNIIITSPNANAVANWTAPTANDNCGAPTVTSNFAPGSTFPVGITTVNYTATDAKGNFSNCSFTVTVTQFTGNPCDNVLISGNSGKIVIQNVSTSAATVQVFNSIWTPISTTQMNSSATQINVPSAGIYYVKVTILGVGGTWPSLCERVFTVSVATSTACDTDITKPLINNCPSNINLTTSTTSAIANWTAPTATDNCSTPTLSSSHNAGMAFPIGNTTVTYTATDAKNNTATCSFIVNVTATNPCDADITKPIINDCPSNINLTTNTTSAIANWTAPTATDNCGTPTLSSSHNTGTAFPIGNTTVTYTATDAKNNTATCSFIVNVTATNPCDTDITKPIINNCPSNINLTTNTTSAIANWTVPMATDNCSTPTLSSSHNTGTAFPIGNTTITYTATDAKNNTATCSFIVNVTATNSNPCANLLISGVNNQISVSQISTQAAWIQVFNNLWQPVTSKQVSNSASTTIDIATTGTYIVKVTILGAGGTWPSLCEENFTVNVTAGNPCANDLIAPVINNCPTNISKTATQANTTVNWTAPTATDNCSVPILSSNHAIGEAFPVGITTVVYTATDAKGNTSTCSFTVTIINCVTDTQAPVLQNCPANITLYTATNTAIATWTAPTATDNCGIPSISSSHTSGTAFQLGTSTVTYTATDSKNNTATCSFTVLVTQQNGTNSPDVALSLSAVDINVFTKKYTLIAQNIGTQTAQNIKISIPAPANAVFTGDGKPASSKGTFAQVAGADNRWQAFEWTIPSLAANTSATCTYTLFLQKKGTFTIINTLIAPTTDPNTNNNNTATVISSRSNSIDNLSIDNTYIDNIYPNPSDNYLNIDIISPEEAENNVINIVNVSGITILKKAIAIKKGKNIIPIEVETLSSGMYFILIEKENSKISAKPFIKN